MAYHGRAMGQIERRPGTEGIGPGRGRVGAAQAGRKLAVQLRRCPVPPGPVLWARGALRPREQEGRERASTNPKPPRPLLRWALPSCVKKGWGKRHVKEGGATNSGQSVRLNHRKHRAFIGQFERRPNIFEVLYRGEAETD